MNRQQQALLDSIRAFKPGDLSDIEAALNVIASHAAEIKRLYGALEKAMVATEENLAAIKGALGDCDGGGE